MHESRLLTGIAAVFAGMTGLLAVLGVLYNPVILAVAALFGGVTYLLWSHGTGQLAARLYQRVERQAAANRDGGRRRRARSDGTGERGGFGAGPREEWRGPRAEQRERARRQARQRRETGQRQRTAPTSSDRLSASEAYETLGVDPGADERAVKSAYREKVKDVHPDTEGGDEEAFKQVTRAYERLTGE